MKTAGRRNTYVAACMFQILFFEDKRERRTIWIYGGALFRRCAHGPCESLLSQRTTANDSIGTTTNTNKR